MASAVAAREHLLHHFGIATARGQNEDTLLRLDDHFWLPAKGSLSRRGTWPLYDGRPVSSPSKSRNTSPTCSPSGPSLNSRIVRSWGLARLLMTARAERSSRSASKNLNNKTISLR